MVAAGTGWSTLFHLHVAELAGHSSFSTKKLAVGKDACTYSLGNIYDDKIVHPVAFSEPDLGESAGVGDIVHLNAQACGSLDTLLDGQHLGVARAEREDQVGTWGVATGSRNPQASRRSPGQSRTAPCQRPAYVWRSPT